jgi:hypothetical protein
MDDEKFNRAMRTIGLTCFVKHYELFADMRMPSGSAAAELSSREETFTTHSCRGRVSTARRVFREGRAKEALRMFLSSKISDYDLEQKARRLLLV